MSCFFLLQGCSAVQQQERIRTLKDKGRQHIRDVLIDDFIGKIKWRYRLYDYFGIPAFIYVNEKEHALYVYGFKKSVMLKFPQKPKPLPIVSSDYQLKFINPFLTPEMVSDCIYLIFWIDEKGRIYNARWQGR